MLHSDLSIKHIAPQNVVNWFDNYRRRVYIYTQLQYVKDYFELPNSLSYLAELFRFTFSKSENSICKIRQWQKFVF